MNKRRTREEILNHGLCTKCGKGAINYDYPPYWCKQCIAECSNRRYHRKMQGIHINTPNRSREDVNYRHYRSGAKKRNLEFSITLALFSELVNGSCFYCGETKFLGVDRLDNSMGYKIDNIVSCCKTCNFAKNTLPLSEFMAWIHKLATFQGYKK